MFEVVIIGAGPYGLSIAAHLKARGVNFRIFGSAMHTWLTQMPRGMKLKSEGFASFLYDPDSTFTLEHYCKQEGIPYADLGLPVPLEVFTAYGLEFQRRFVPNLENKLVVSMKRSSAGFEVCLEDGEAFTTRRVIVASGIGHFGYVPPTLSSLPEELVSHSSKHAILDRFRGREVTVIGAGASALDLAALLHQSGAFVQLVARTPVIRFNNRPDESRSLLQQIREPTTGIGTGWKKVFCAEAPLAFHLLPEPIRLYAVQRILGPASTWFVKDQVVGKMPFHLGVSIARATVQNGRVCLALTDGHGVQRSLLTDHVIAATGFKVDLRRLAFLDASIQGAIRSVDQTPILSSSFESSVPGLYFVGTASANSFGPLMRFAFGAGFAARRVTKHLARSAFHVRNPSASAAQALRRG